MINFLKIVIIFCGGLLPISYASQCYPDAKTAYNALIAKQKMIEYANDNFMVNINTAHPSQLISLKGIGVKTAEAIVVYRQTVGEFKSVDELANVKGIGQKTIDNNRHRLTVR